MKREWEKDTSELQDARARAICERLEAILEVLDPVRLTKAGKKPLKATVPELIVAYLELKVGDKLQWKIESDDDYGRVAVVWKAKPIAKKPRPKPKRR